jgi:hypothetical protein
VSVTQKVITALILVVLVFCCGVFLCNLNLCQLCQFSNQSKPSDHLICYEGEGIAVSAFHPGNQGQSSAFSYTENHVGTYLGIYPWAMALPPLGWLESDHL